MCIPTLTELPLMSERDVYKRQDFDLDTGEVCDALTVIYICGDGAEEAYRYPLTGEERAVLRTRMDGYCMEQTGMGLEEHRSQYLAETDGPAQGPRM